MNGYIKSLFEKVKYIEDKINNLDITDRIDSYIKSNREYLKGDKGEPGESIKGDKGDKGEDGKDGKDGIDGKSIKGDKGDRGPRGFKGKDGITTIKEIIKKVPLKKPDFLKIARGLEKLDNNDKLDPEKGLKDFEKAVRKYQYMGGGISASYADGRYVNVSGDTMEGDLVFPSTGLIATDANGGTWRFTVDTDGAWVSTLISSGVVSNFLLETGDVLLLETGDKLLLE